MRLARLFYAVLNGEVRAFHTFTERDAFVAHWQTMATVRAVTYREIKTFYRANLPGGRRRFQLPNGEWIAR